MSDDKVPTAGGEEHRRAPRIARTFVVKYGWRDGERVRWGVSQTKNLSATGMRFSGERPFEVGQVLEFELRVSTAEQPLHVNGRIVWTRPTGALSMIEYGVEFVDVDAATARHLSTGLEFFLRPPAQWRPSGDRERRKDPRAVLQLLVRYRTLGGAMNIWYVGSIDNLSAGGVKLLTDQLLEEGASVEVEITLPSRKDPYILRGCVVSEHPASLGRLEYGITFTDAGIGDRLEFENLVRFLTPPRTPPS